MTGYDAWNAEAAAAIIASEAAIGPANERQGRALPILHALQGRFGCIDQAAVPLIAEALNLSRAEIIGTISFYHDFRAAPAGTHVLKLCRAEACQSMGGDRLHAQCRRHLGIDWHGTTGDGAITLEPVFCLGLCAAAPAALLDERPLARLTEATLAAALAEVRA